jgi:hypothetical protein
MSLTRIKLREVIAMVPAWWVVVGVAWEGIRQRTIKCPVVGGMGVDG